MDTFDLRKFLVENKLTTNSKIEEEKVEQDLEKGLEAAFKDLARELEANKQELTEGGAMMIAGVSIAMPALIKLIGKVTNKVSRFFGGSGKTGEKMIAVADKMHHFLVGLIEKALKGLGMKDEKAIHKTAEALFMVVVASLLVTSGIGLVKALKASSFPVAGLEGAMVAVKNGEIASYLSNLLAAG